MRRALARVRPPGPVPQVVKTRFLAASEIAKTAGGFSFRSTESRPKLQ
jgi:hypothetical protein